MPKRSRRSLERRLRLSGIKRFKPIADFEWNWPSKIERDVVERALTLDFIAENPIWFWSDATVWAKR